MDEGEPGRSVITRSSLREQVANALREELMSGRLAAGRHFTVKEIAGLYGVSATPVREALVDLSGQGLLRVEHHRGFAVPRLDWPDFLEIIEARTLVTDGMFKLLDGGLGRVDWSRLPSLHRRAESAARAVHNGQLDVVVGCDRRFWYEVAGLIGNRRLMDYLDRLRVQSWMYGARYLRGRPELVARCWDGQLELTGLVADRDLAGVRSMVTAYNGHSLRLMAELGGETTDRVHGNHAQS